MSLPYLSNYFIITCIHVILIAPHVTDIHTCMVNMPNLSLVVKSLYNVMLSVYYACLFSSMRYQQSLPLPELIGWVCSVFIYHTLGVATVLI